MSNLHTLTTYTLYSDTLHHTGESMSAIKKTMLHLQPTGSTATVLYICMNAQLYSQEWCIQAQYVFYVGDEDKSQFTDTNFNKRGCKFRSLIHFTSLHVRLATPQCLGTDLY